MGAARRNCQGLEPPRHIVANEKARWSLGDHQRHRSYAPMSGGSAKGAESTPDLANWTEPVLAKVTGAKQLTLPDELLTSFPGVDCFNVTEEGGRIVLTPVRVSRVDAVRRKLAELGITDEDVRDAVAWARRRN